jgi:hypothetical protein
MVKSCTLREFLTPFTGSKMPEAPAASMKRNKLRFQASDEYPLEEWPIGRTDCRVISYGQELWRRMLSRAVALAGQSNAR